VVVAGVNHAGVNHAGVNDAGSAVTTPDTRPADGDNDELDITVDFTDAAIRRAVEAAPDGILVIEADGNIVVANPMACELFGYSRHDLVGANVDLLLPDGLRAEFCACHAALTREAPLRGEDAVRATVRKLSSHEADELACSVVRLFAAMVREGARAEARESPEAPLNAAAGAARTKVLKSVPQVISLRAAEA